MDHITLSACAEVGFQVAGSTGAHGAMRALRRVIPLDAYEFVAFDPATGRHRSLVSDGLRRPPGPLPSAGTPAAGGGGPYPMDGARLAAYGWRQGLTTPLLLADGRYTGLLNLSAPRFPAHALTVMAALSPTLAHVTDLTRCVIDPVGLPSGFSAVAFDRGGVVRDVAGVPRSEVVAADPAMAGYARAFLDSRELSRRGLWQDRGGRWREVRVLRAGVGSHGALQGAVVAERPCCLPYELTAREAQVLTRVAAGDSNPQIAAALVLSVRTVTTHLEHIFAKLGCDSRTRVTTKALAEGLCVIDL
ncbi:MULTISPECIES: response regulator transcription factor [unclassified Nonomuraea]